MYQITVIGPINGVYHLGYQAKGSSVFYSINPFVSRALAEIAARRMKQARQKGVCNGW